MLTTISMIRKATLTTRFSSYTSNNNLLSRGLTWKNETLVMIYYTNVVRTCIYIDISICSKDITKTRFGSNMYSPWRRTLRPILGLMSENRNLPELNEQVKEKEITQNYGILKGASDLVSDHVPDEILLKARNDHKLFTFLIVLVCNVHISPASLAPRKWTIFT